MVCVLLDIDGTLLRGPASERLFWRHLATHGQLGWRQWIMAAAFLLRWWPIYGRHVAKKNKAYLAGLRVAEVEHIAGEFASHKLSGNMRPSILARVEQHRRAGDRLALLTGAPDFIARPLAARLDAQAYSATVCAVQGGRFGAAPPTLHPFGAEKLEQATMLCRRLDCHIKDCVAYADSFYDVPLLEAVGRPVAVHPDHRLRRLAEQRNWEIVEQ